MKVFIGSSGEQRRLVDWLTAFIRREYRGRLEPIPWTIPWPGGQYVLENLLGFIDRTDAAILFWTADDKNGTAIPSDMSLGTILFLKQDYSWLLTARKELS